MKNIQTYEGFLGNLWDPYKNMKDSDLYDEFEVTPSKKVGPDVIQKFQLNISVPRNFSKEIYRIAAENKVQISNIKDVGKDVEIHFTGIEKNAQAFVHDMTTSTWGKGRGSQNVEFWSIPN